MNGIVKALEKEIDRLIYLNLASVLRNELKDNMPCPVCGSRHHEDIEDITNNDEVEFLKEKLNNYLDIEKSININLENCNSKNGEYLSAEKIKQKELNELKSKIGELNSIELDSKLEEENRKLASLRESLLPKLMNGEIEVEIC